MIEWPECSRLDMSSDPDKNYRTLEKAMAKLFKNYPPRVDKPAEYDRSVVAADLARLSGNR
jgi:hypothetical protein